MKHIILLAGFPATGKTYMSNIIKAQYPHAMYISQDAFKELLYDTVGFNNIEEKNDVITMSRTMFYSAIEKSLAHNQMLLLDYPFSYKQIEFLDNLKEQFKVEIMTVRLIGDLDVLYQRRVIRDLKPERNKGHILDCYNGYESYNADNYPLSKEQYKANCLKGNYHHFAYGPVVELDVSDYDKIDYDLMLATINRFVQK